MFDFSCVVQHAAYLMSMCAEHFNLQINTIYFQIFCLH